MSLYFTAIMRDFIKYQAFQGTNFGYPMHQSLSNGQHSYRM
ncbi:MAG TPA: hypothetical protein PKY86_08325 [Niabella sp.]|nr:hypothetical protein [Niabella sp.]HQX21418.1 hypothetical protein [Niabella sp.]HRB36140.1 hypothetical protein [Niabella sp.]HRB80198.1 hypothetical protein [Niabella sp.]